MKNNKSIPTVVASVCLICVIALITGLCIRANNKPATIVNEEAREFTSDRMDFLSKKECIKLLEDSFDENGLISEEAKETLDNETMFYQLDNEGYGVCLFNTRDTGRSHRYSYLATTQDYGKHWDMVIDEVFPGHGYMEYAYFDRTFFSFTYYPESHSTSVFAISVPDGNEKETNKISFDGLEEISDSKTNACQYMHVNVIDVTEKTVTLEWYLDSYSVSEKNDYKKDSDGNVVVFVAEYDSEMNVVKEIFSDRAPIDELIKMEHK